MAISPDDKLLLYQAPSLSVNEMTATFFQVQITTLSKENTNDSM